MNWPLKLNWLEMATLALIVPMVLNPVFFMERMSPRWLKMEPEAFHKAAFIEVLRLTTSRRADHGEQRYVQVFKFDKNNNKVSDRPGMMWTILGVSGQYTSSPDHVLIVTKIRLSSPAQKAGIQSNDHVMSIERLNKNRLPKEMIYFLALMLFIAVIASSRLRLRNNQNTP